MTLIRERNRMHSMAKTGTKGMALPSSAPDFSNCPASTEKNTRWPITKGIPRKRWSSIVQLQPLPVRSGVRRPAHRAARRNSKIEGRASRRYDQFERRGRTIPTTDFENSWSSARRRKKFQLSIYLRDARPVASPKPTGATHTPHLFVFDSKRALAYTGRIDDNWQELPQA